MSHIAIWKFPIEMNKSRIFMPKGAEVLTVQMQNDVPCIWAKVDADLKVEERVFVIHATGQLMDKEHGEYIGTFQTIGGAFVWHLFEAKVAA